MAFATVLLVDFKERKKIMFIKMANLQMQLLLLMLVGFVIKKKNIIDDRQISGLSELLINVILPSTIIKSFISNRDGSLDVFNDYLMVAFVCLLLELVLIIILPKMLKVFGEEKAKVMEYGLLVPNSGFIGLPVIEYMYESTMVMYASFYLIPLNITMWTVALSLYTKENSFKVGLKKVILHPCIMAIVIGLILMAFNIQLPSAITGAVEMIAKSSGCISMLAVGAIIADIKWNNIIDISTVSYSILRLIILPLIVYFTLLAFHVNEMVIISSTLMTAMPCGTMCPVLAKKYGSDYKFAGKLMLVSSIFSIVTVSCICLLF